MLLQDNRNSNAAFECCQASCCGSQSSNCCCRHLLDRLFIKQANKPQSQTNISHPRTISNYVASTLLVVCLICASICNEKVAGEQQQQQQQVQQQEIKTQTSLPTVIVRGFLNYRTTVDGTVLLFTPDAGSGSSSLQTSQSIAPSSAPAFNFAVSSTATAQIQQDSQLAGDQLVEPTSVFRQQPLVSSTFYMRPTNLDENFAPVVVADQSNTNQQQFSRDQNQHQPVAADEWRPIQATPPLKLSTSMQTTFRPSLVNLDGLEVAQQSSKHQQHLLVASVSSGNPSRERDQEHKSTPSVQADDILLGEPQQNQQISNNNANQAAPSSTSASETAAPVTPTVSRATRPKRPSLGFNGQGLRSRAGNRSPSNGNQSEAQSSNTINGIRRPGLSTTTTVAPPSSSSQSSSGGGESSNISGAFQNRLTTASVRLRNKLRRPPIGGNSTTTTTTTTTTTSGSLAGSVQAASSAALLQPAESGEDLLSGENHQLAAAASAAAINQGINPDQSSLTSRIGDIFNAGSSLIGPSPVVGNEDVLAAAASRGESTQSKPANEQQQQQQLQQETGGEASIEPLTISSEGQDSDKSNTGMKPTSRSGEQKPRDDKNQNEPQFLSGGLSGTIEPLQQGQLGVMPLSFDSFFQNDQATTGNSESSSEPQPSFRSKADSLAKNNNNNNNNGGGKNNNDRLNSWLGTHHNKFIPRPSLHRDHNHHDQAGHLSHQLAANLNQLAPSFSSNLPSSGQSASSSVIKPTPVSGLATTSLLSSSSSETLKPSVGSVDELTSDYLSSSSNKSSNETLNKSSSSNNEVEANIEKGDQQQLTLQTITKTYSTIMTKSKTRLVPLQVKSSTAIYTITENYVITKMLTAYQTMPIGEFILPETLSTRAPYDMFNEQQTPTDTEKVSASAKEPSIAAPFIPGPIGQPETQPEQPISLDTSPKSPNDWLHDFSNLNNANFNSNSPSQQQQQQQQQQLQTNNLAALLEQQAQEANLAGFPSLSEPLDQLASSLDPAADGTINIPDLNNPLVLAAAIQNPQLAAVILAAQQLQLKQRQNKQHQHANNNNNHNNIQPAIQLQPSYSTSFSTTIKNSIYTVRDTMYTTRLVSFKDGRTVRTRTVSEPGSVIEQVLTTMATEVTPITITIRPTGMLTNSLATAPPGGNQASNNQATINNALFATQLANLLARRQQVVPNMSGGSNPLLAAAAAAAANGSNQQPYNQIAALQQLIGQQRQHQSKQFQPNIQQLLQSMQQQPSSSPSSLSAQPTSSSSSSSSSSLSQQSVSNSGQASDKLANSAASVAASSNVEKKTQEAVSSPSQTATPVLPALPILPGQPFTTTFTNLQVKTYTVHNAFKTIYRTITSTQLITSTILQGTRNTQLPNMG